MFDGTINLGMVIQTIVIILGGIYYVWEMKFQLKLLANNQTVIDSKLEFMNSKLNELSRTAIEIARQDERISAQDARIQEISNRISHLSTLIIKA